MGCPRHLLTSFKLVLHRPNPAQASRFTQTLPSQSLPPLQSNRLHPRLLSTTQVFYVESNPHPKRDAQQNREEINTESNEYSKSGTDDASAGQEEAAFNPDITNPQKEKEKAGEGNEVNPLEVSPANPEISKGTAENDTGAGTKK